MLDVGTRTTALGAGGRLAVGLATVAAVTAAAQSRGRTVAQLFRPGGPTTVIAHRGLSARAPENTPAAFRGAIAAGADMLELDVTDSADGRLVVIHDETVNRTTDGRGRVRRMTFDQLRRLDAGSWFSRKFAGERIPTLGEVLDLAAGRVAVNVEIKSEASVGAVRAAVAEIRSRNLQPYTLLSSFSEDHLRLALQLAPDIPRAVLFDRLPDDPCGLAEELDAVGVHVRRRAVSPELVAECHRRGLALSVFTVNRRSRMEDLVDMGVDGVFTDQPARLLDIVEETERTAAPTTPAAA